MKAGGLVQGISPRSEAASAPRVLIRERQEHLRAACLLLGGSGELSVGNAVFFWTKFFIGLQKSLRSVLDSVIVS